MALSKSKCDYSYKLMVVGDDGVGRSCFSSANASYTPREPIGDFIGFDLREQILTVNGTRVPVKIWIPKYAPAFIRSRKASYKNVHGVFILYDVTSPESFANVKEWLKEVRLSGGENLTIVIIGNKCDLIMQRTVSFEEAQKFAIESNIPVVEVSARNTINVTQALQRMILHIQSRSSRSDENTLDASRFNLFPVGLLRRCYNRILSAMSIKPGTNDRSVQDKNIPYQANVCPEVAKTYANSIFENLSAEIHESAEMRDTADVDAGAMQRIEILPVDGPTMEAKNKQPVGTNADEIVFSNTVSRADSPL